MSIVLKTCLSIIEHHDKGFVSVIGYRVKCCFSLIGHSIKSFVSIIEYSV